MADESGKQNLEQRSRPAPSYPPASFKSVHSPKRSEAEEKAEAEQLEIARQHDLDAQRAREIYAIEREAIRLRRAVVVAATARAESIARATADAGDLSAVRKSAGERADPPSVAVDPTLAQYRRPMTRSAANKMGRIQRLGNELSYLLKRDDTKDSRNNNDKGDGASGTGVPANA